jgi:serine/threonine protein phosphatase PrpC
VLESTSVSARGGRDGNQDVVRHLLADGYACWVVADGLGGHKGGERAARIAASALLERFATHPSCTASALEGYVQAAQQAVVARADADADLRGMRTTLAVLVTDHRVARWAHVGDTRVYRLRGGRIVDRTRDHSLAEFVAGSADAAAMAAGGSRHQLLRAIGDDVAPIADISAPVSVAPGDAFLLCTDGFWEDLDDGAIEATSEEADWTSDWMERLLARIDQKPGKDNYSATTLLVHGCSRAASVAAPMRASSDAEARLDRAPRRGPRWLWLVAAGLLIAGTLIAWSVGAAPAIGPRGVHETVPRLLR